MLLPKIDIYLISEKCKNIKKGDIKMKIKESKELLIISVLTLFHIVGIVYVNHLHSLSIENAVNATEGASLTYYGWIMWAMIFSLSIMWGVYLAKKSILYLISGIIVSIIISVIGLGMNNVDFYKFKEWFVIISMSFYFMLNVYMLYIYSHRNITLKTTNSLRSPITFVVSVRPIAGVNEKYMERVLRVIDGIKNQDIKKEILVFMADKTDGQIINALKGTDYKIFYNVAEKLLGANQAIGIAKYDLLYYVDDNTVIPNDAFKLQNYLDEETVCVSGVRYYPRSYKNNLFVDFYSRLTYSLFFGEKMKMQAMDIFVNYSGSNGLFKRSYLVENNFTYGNINRTEDVETSYRAYLVAGKKMKIVDIQSEDLAPKDFISLINQRMRWSEGWIQTHYQYFSRIKAQPFKLRVDLYRRALGTYIGFLLFPLSIALLFSEFNAIGMMLFAFNWLIGAVQIANAYKLELSEKIVGTVIFPVIFMFGYLIDTSAMLKVMNKDAEWFSTRK